MEAKAMARYIRISPRKVRQVMNLIRGRKVKEALDILSFTPKKAAYLIRKVLFSALANATQRRPKLNPEELYIKKVYADGGPTLRRIRARAMGRVGSILKRTTHITVVVGDREGV
ncbi:TPA: 50S ribosomal protein L22 [bacterium]|nr:50S ribosomal protein L22 [bacterium]